MFHPALMGLLLPGLVARPRGVMWMPVWTGFGYILVPVGV